MKENNFGCKKTTVAFGWVGLVVAAFLIFSSCSALKFMPVKDLYAINAITQIQGDGDGLSLAIMDSQNRTFEAYKSNYELINAEIVDLLLHQQARLHGKVLASQATQLQSIFNVWYEYHAKNIEISNAMVEDFQKQFDAACYAMLISENSLND